MVGPKELSLKYKYSSTRVTPTLQPQQIPTYTIPVNDPETEYLSPHLWLLASDRHVC